MNVLITGGARGLGYELSKQFDTVHVLDVALPKKPLAHVTYHQIDITNDTSVREVLEEIGALDILIHNAAVMLRGTMRCSPEEFDRVWNINVRAAWMLTRHASLSSNAVLVMINSRHGLQAVVDPGMYSFTKQCLSVLASHVRALGYCVKEAFLGPFDGGVSRTGYDADAYAQRDVLSVVDASLLVHKLIISPAQKLVFDNEKKKYFFE